MIRLLWSSIYSGISGLISKVRYQYTCNRYYEALRNGQTILLPPTKEDVNAFARVCLSICLSARLLKNACVDLDEMLHVDRCRDMDELINF